MDMHRLIELDNELDQLEISYDLCMENGLDDKNRLLESQFKLREIIRKNNKWRKELLSLLKCKYN